MQAPSLLLGADNDTPTPGAVYPVCKGGRGWVRSFKLRRFQIWPSFS